MRLTAEELSRYDGEARCEIYVSFNGKADVIGNMNQI